MKYHLLERPRPLVLESPPNELFMKNYPIGGRLQPASHARQTTVLI